MFTQSSSLSLCALRAVVVLGSCSAASAAPPACVDVGGTRFCLSWSRSAAPAIGRDFRVSAGGDGPVVTLIAGDPAWNLVATEIASGEPADVGGVSIEPRSSLASFGLKFENGDSPAVDQVGYINLTSAGWSGSSRILGGSIGSLTGDLRLQKNAIGKGGDIEGNFLVGDVSGSVEVAAISNGLVAVSDLSGSFVVRESVSSAFITAVNVRAGSVLDVSGLSRSRLELGTVGGPDLEGYVAIRGGIPAESFVFVRCHNEGVIDLAGGDVDDFLETSGGGGHIINGGTVKSNGHVWVSQLEENTFSGTAEFKQVDEGGVIEAEVSNIDGVIHVTGDMNGQLYARVGPLLPHGAFDIDGDVGRSGRVLVAAAGQAEFGGDLHGRIWVGGTVYGRVEVEREVLAGSTLYAGGLADGGWIDLNSGAGNTAGTIFVGSMNKALGVGVDFDGCLHIGGDFSGDLTVRGCHKTSDPLNICIDGASSGRVSLQQAGCREQVGVECSGCP
jgi:hypothetical protein